MRAYLVDRLVTKAWTLAQIQGELGVAPATLRRLLDQHQVRRGGADRAEHAAAVAAVGPAKQARAVQQRRQARLAELGFATLDRLARSTVFAEWIRKNNQLLCPLGRARVNRGPEHDQ
jgi:transposase-like protein